MFPLNPVGSFPIFKRQHSIGKKIHSGKKRLPLWFIKVYFPCCQILPSVIVFALLIPQKCIVLRYELLNYKYQTKH